MHELPCAAAGTMASMAGADDLDWDDLRYFRCAAQAGTLAGAARALGVEHTTIGRRLGALERSLGVPLVLRRPDGLQLTALGERIVPLVDEMERTVLAIRDAVASQGTRVRLAVPSGFTVLFAPRLAQLCKEVPGLALELVSGSRPVDLERGEADLAIRSGTVTDKDLVARRLCDAGFALYAAREYVARRPVDPDDLRGHDVIGYDRSLADLGTAQWLESRSAGATIVMRSREMAEMLTAAVGGAGVAVLPCMLADAEPALVRLTPDVVTTRVLSLVYRREVRLSAQIRAVVRFVKEVIDANADRIAGVVR